MNFFILALGPAPSVFRYQAILSSSPDAESTSGWPSASRSAAKTERAPLAEVVTTFERLKLASENPKKGLSVEDTVQIEIPDVAKDEAGNPLSVSRTLTADEFSKLTIDLIQRTFKVCDEALQQAGVLARELDGVVLVGRPWRPR